MNQAEPRARFLPRAASRALLTVITCAIALWCGALWAGAAASLAMHWAMEPWSGATGALETDIAGTSASLVSFPEDGSEWMVGVLGRALVFDGVDRHVQHDAPLPRSEGTIGHWLRPSTAAGTRVALYESDFSGAASPDYNGFGASGDALEIHTGIFDGDWYAVWQDGDVTERREVRGGTVTANEWTHVAVTWQIPGEMKLYVNCVEVSRVAMDAAFAGHAPTEHFLGKPSQFDGRHWPGAMDEVKVWDREFTAAGVRSHFCPELLPESNVVPAQTPAAGDRFGDSAALSGDWLLVRSPGASAVSWYSKQGATDFQFNSARPSVFTDAISSGTATAKPLDIAGSLAAIADADGVEVFELTAPNSWNPITTLTDPAAENFGHAIAVSGDRIAVGAPSSGGGGAYVFERDQGGPGAWGATFIDIPGGFDPEEFTGRLMDLDGDLLAVYKQITSLGGNTDRVDLHRRGEMGGVAGWLPEGDFTADGDTIVSLAVRGDRVAVGIVDPTSENAGSVVVRRRDEGGPNQWGVEHILIASDVDPLDRLGAELVWLNDNTLAASAPGSDRDHQPIYIFRVGGPFVQTQSTILIQKTFDPITETGAVMGRSLTGTGGLIIAGAPLTGFSVTDPPAQPGFSGRLHLFLLPVIFSDGFESGGL